MAHYDKDTEKFMEEVALDRPTPHRSLKEQIARQTVGVARDLTKGKHLPEIAAKRLIGMGTFQALTKEGGLSPVQLFALLNREYNDDWQDWEPETLWLTLDTEHGIEASPEVKNMIQALQVVCKTNFPFEDWHVFENVGHAFNQNPVNFGLVQPLELDEIALTMKILKEIRPEAEYEDDIYGYIAACAKHSGVVFLPPHLFGEQAQGFLDGLGNDMDLKSQVMQNFRNDYQGETESALGVQLARLAEVHAATIEG